MPKVDALPQLQEQVKSYVATASACELGKTANLHRSTVLRFCKTGRATPATAQKLTKAMAVLLNTRSSASDDTRVVKDVVSDRATTHPHPIPQELTSLRTMLQTLLSLIDGQYGRGDLAGKQITAPTGEPRPASQ